ncbi:MAG: peptide deformylase [Cyanobacteria bacterium]|nr:peptide deformylase [Cyanobacteriota bacterium]
MSILKVARMGHPVLRTKARTLDKSELKNPVIQQFIDSMIDTMYEYSGVGLAAPQVHEGLRVFVAMLDPDGRGEGDAVTFINPEILPIGDATVEGWEGCLSIPEVRGRVPRAQHIKVSALDRHGKRFELELKDFPARVVQHETDHLDGVLFLDRMKSFESLTYLEEYSRYHTRQGDEDEADE